MSEPKYRKRKLVDTEQYDRILRQDFREYDPNLNRLAKIVKEIKSFTKVKETNSVKLSKLAMPRAHFDTLYKELSPEASLSAPVNIAGIKPDVKEPEAAEVAATAGEEEPDKTLELPKEKEEDDPEIDMDFSKSGLDKAHKAIFDKDL